MTNQEAAKSNTYDKFWEKLAVAVLVTGTTFLVTTLVAATFPPAAPLASLLAGPTIGAFADKALQYYKDQNNAKISERYKQEKPKNEDENLTKVPTQKLESNLHTKEHQNLGPHTFHANQESKLHHHDIKEIIEEHDKKHHDLLKDIIEHKNPRNYEESSRG